MHAMTAILLLFLVLITGLWVFTLRELGLIQKMYAEQPMVWTTKGNLPGSVLEYRTDWFESEMDITFVEEYWYQGEMVKRSAHKRSKKGVEALGIAADLN